MVSETMAPRLRETGTPRIPAQRSRRSLWNTALLDIEQISSYYKNKYKGLMLQRSTSARRHYACDTTLALCQQRNNSQQQNTSSSRTTTKVVNSTLQGLWLGHDLARMHGNHRQSIKQSWHHLQSGMTRQVSTLNVLARSKQPKQSRKDNNIALSSLIKLTATTI